jgi:large subunit ribosomal protein L10
MLNLYGDDQLDALATIKSREELIGELIDYFNHQHRVISALQNQPLRLLRQKQ